MNPKGSPSDAEKKRSSASAELQESPTEVGRRTEKNFANVAKVFRRMNELLTPSIEKEIVLPLMKVYRYVKSDEPSSKVAKRKVDMSTKESESQQCAGPSNLFALEKEGIVAGAESKKLFASDQTSDSSNDEDRDLCLPNTFHEECKKMWNAEYNSVVGDRLAMRSPLSIFRKLVYLEVFFLYNCLESEPSRPNCRESAISVDECGSMVSRIRQLQIDRRDFNPEQVLSFTDEEYKSKIVYLCGKEKEIANVLMLLTKRILYHYFHSCSVYIREFGDYIYVISVLVDNIEILSDNGKTLKVKKSSSDNIELLTYFYEMDRQIKSISMDLYEFLNIDNRAKKYNLADV